MCCRTSRSLRGAEWEGWGSPGGGHSLDKGSGVGGSSDVKNGRPGEPGQLGALNARPRSLDVFGGSKKHEGPICSGARV